MPANWKAEPESGGHPESDRPHGWATWLVFAGVMLTLMGFLQILAGLTSLLDEGFYVISSEGLVIDVDYTLWGWVQLSLGAIAMATAFGLLRGNIVGRVMAVVIAGVNALVSLVFLPAYPWWAVVAIAFNVLVIYAITMHGSEVRSR
jgi:hypothetical protein